MKRVLILCVVVMLFFCWACAESIPLDSLSVEELYALRAQIDARLSVAEEGTVVYDEGGILVAWYGIERNEDRFDGGYEYQLDFLITNSTGDSIQFDFTSVCINGFAIAGANNISKEVAPGSSVFTAATNVFFFDDGTLADSRIETIETARAVLRIRDLDRNELALVDYTASIDGFLE